MSPRWVRGGAGAIVPSMGRPELREDITVAIIGCGLIGGSIGLAVRRRWPRATVIGVDRPRIRTLARRRNAIAHETTRRALWRRLHTVDLLVLATDVDTIIADLQALPAEAPVTLDVGSVKAPIVAAAHERGNFVGGHPMAGSERGGIEHASASLFDERRFVLTPAASTRRAAMRRCSAFVRGLGAHPIVLDAHTHDRCVALVSHLPHVLAQCLMQQGAALGDTLVQPQLPWRIAAGSWRDATRVAAANPTAWASIFGHNREAVGEALDALIDGLQAARAALADAEPPVPNAADLARLRTRISRFLPPVR